MFGFVHGLPGNSGFTPGAAALAKRKPNGGMAPEIGGEVVGEAFAIFICLLICLV